MITLKDLRVEYRTNPIDVGTMASRFSWKIESDGQNVKQNAHTLELALNQDFNAPL